MQSIGKSFTSRKFLLALVGIITGIVTILEGEMTAGAGLIGSSIIAYLIAEGMIDVQYAKEVTKTTSEVLETISKVTPNVTDDQVSEIVKEIIRQMEAENKEKLVL